MIVDVNVISPNGIVSGLLKHEQVQIQNTKHIMHLSLCVCVFFLVQKRWYLFSARQCEFSPIRLANSSSQEQVQKS